MTAKPRYWKSLQLHEGRIVSARDKSPWVVGEWREVPAPTCECEGLNCCENIIDAMGYVNMGVLAEVEIDGVRIDGDNKITVQRMRLIGAWNWGKMDSVALSVYAADLVVGNFEKAFPTDSRVRDTINLVRKYLIDPTSVTEDELRSAAWSAAWSAAESAARSARSAARSAAWSARSAAWSAESAAWSAAWSAESAARSAAESAESARLAMKKKIHNWIVKRTKDLVEVS